MLCCKPTLLLLEAVVFRAFEATFGNMVLFYLEQEIG